MCGDQHRWPFEEQRGGADGQTRYRPAAVILTPTSWFILFRLYNRLFFSCAGPHYKPRQRPRIIAGPQNVTASLHQTVVLECVATGNPSPIISWSRADSKPIDVYNAKVLGNGNLVIADVASKHAGVYLCRATTPGTRNHTVAAANLTVQGREPSRGATLVLSRLQVFITARV